MNITTRIVALALGASIITGGALAIPAVANAKPPTVKQVNDQVELVVNDQRDAITQYHLYELAQMQTICQGQVTHATALKAMVRPKPYPKATWKILMQGADAYVKAASECVAAAQRAIDTLGHENDTSGFKQVQVDWTSGNNLVNQAAAALRKAKIH